ncbi:hypothetical protein N805_20345 [Pseudomonas putida S13.1.2]|uniref:Uncharacterized protein n=1 Tax=Pseudomonas putida S13.1.2 TaxID=1384061 RepID=A0AAU8RZW6_PSEPU|nr:hypothetical protein N805_20345 [Pseudomonas putida S13.1.2]
MIIYIKKIIRQYFFWRTHISLYFYFIKKFFFIIKLGPIEERIRFIGTCRFFANQFKRVCQSRRGKAANTFLS